MILWQWHFCTDGLYLLHLYRHLFLNWILILDLSEVVVTNDRERWLRVWGKVVYLYHQATVLIPTVLVGISRRVWRMSLLTLVVMHKVVRFSPNVDTWTINIFTLCLLSFGGVHISLLENLLIPLCEVFCVKIPAWSQAGIYEEVLICNVSSTWTWRSLVVRRASILYRYPFFKHGRLCIRWNGLFVMGTFLHVLLSFVYCVLELRLKVLLLLTMEGRNQWLISNA